MATPKGACCNSGPIPAPAASCSSAPSHASRAGLRRRRCGGSGSSTRPPPSVWVAAESRAMKRSPHIAQTGASNTSCTNCPSPWSWSSSSTTWACRCIVPQWICSGAQSRNGAANADSRNRTSTRVVASSARASAIQSPRRMSSRAMAARFSAQRCPAIAWSLAWFCAWMLRMRTSVAAGISCRCSPTAAMPPCTAPVTSVPWPASENTRSTGMRNSSLRSSAGACWRRPPPKRAAGYAAR